MSAKSNDNGRAYEYACLIELKNQIRARACQVQIQTDEGYAASLKAWQKMDKEVQDILLSSARAGVSQLFPTEPNMVEDTGDVIFLSIQTDDKGKAGDIRDILIRKREEAWLIGLSVKHNHEAVKHSRLSAQLDFGEKWYGYKCSEQYWEDIKPVFDLLKELKSKDKLFSEIEDKEDCVYVPLLNAFIDELKRQVEAHLDIPKKMVAYLLGRFDFYKLISKDSQREVFVQAFNLYGTLNQANRLNTQAVFRLERVELPTKIMGIGFCDGKKNKIELTFNNGWAFTFRLHNAKSKVEPSLKFDIQIVGMPTSIITFKASWSKLL